MKIPKFESALNSNSNQIQRLEAEKNRIEKEILWESELNSRDSFFSIWRQKYDMSISDAIKYDGIIELLPPFKKKVIKEHWNVQHNKLEGGVAYVFSEKEKNFIKNYKDFNDNWKQAEKEVVAELSTNDRKLWKKWAEITEKGRNSTEEQYQTIKRIFDNICNKIDENVGRKLNIF